jgi:hypothetical protein
MLDALKAIRAGDQVPSPTSTRATDHRHSSLGAVKAVICGPYGYIVAVQAAAHMLGALPEGFPKPLRAVGGPAKR